MKQKRCKDCIDWVPVFYDEDKDGRDLFYEKCDQEGLWKPYGAIRNGGSFACQDFERRKKK